MSEVSNTVSQKGHTAVSSGTILSHAKHFIGRGGLYALPAQLHSTSNPPIP